MTSHYADMYDRSSDRFDSSDKLFTTLAVTLYGAVVKRAVRVYDAEFVCQPLTFLERFVFYLLVEIIGIQEKGRMYYRGDIPGEEKTKKNTVKRRGF